MTKDRTLSLSNCLIISERKAVRERLVSDWVYEKEAVRERIIKNCKIMNILLNKYVE